MRKKDRKAERKERDTEKWKR